MLTLALIVVTTITTALANNKEGVSEKAIESFKKEYASAQDVKWESSKEFAKATFSMYGQVMFAYYNHEGQFIALSRNLLSGQLPISLSAELKKTYTSYWISDVFEVASTNETNYYATVQNADMLITLKSNGSSGWEVFKKEKKSI